MSGIALPWAPAVPMPGHVAHLFRLRLGPPAIAPTEVDRLLEHYALSAARPPVTLPGRRNDNVLVRTTAGDKVLRRHRAGWDRRSIEHEHSILLELERQGFPAVRVERAIDGATVIERHGRFHALFAFEEGTNITGLRFTGRRVAAMLQQAGATLAAFHDALRDFEPAWVHHADDLASGHARTGRSPAASQRCDGQPEPPPGIEDRIDELEAELTDRDLPRTVLHTDFGPHNLLFRSGRDPIVLDLELARRGRRVSDLLTTLSRLRPGPASHVVAGYRGATTLTDDEVRLAPRVWELDCLRAGLRSWHNHQLLGGDGRLRTAQARLDRAGFPPPNLELLR